MLTILRYMSIIIAVVSGGVSFSAALLYVFEVMIAKVTSDMDWLIHNWSVPMAISGIMSLALYILLTEVQMRGGR